MQYSLEEARARETELLRSARTHRVASVPRQERRTGLTFSRLVGIVRWRHAEAQKPAIAQ